MTQQTKSISIEIGSDQRLMLLAVRANAILKQRAYMKIIGLSVDDLRSLGIFIELLTEAQS